MTFALMLMVLLWGAIIHSKLKDILEELRKQRVTGEDGSNG